MANPEHVEILKQGAEVWNKWREDNPNIRPDLNLVNIYGTSLNGANLSKVDLKSANFNQINLNRANLSWSDLNRAVFIGSELRQVNLSHSFLREINFIKAFLNDADLSYADLSRANLRGANLSMANFSHTDLHGSNLSEAILEGAFLRKANIIEANLSQAVLDQVIFDKTWMGSTILSKVDLHSVKGLKDIRHLGPSSIGIDTIYKSKGKIPKIFLRGCGVPENFIRYMKSLTMNPIEYYSCFISYSHEDKLFARRLHDQLQARGIRCWLDDHQILPGDDIYEQVDRGIRMWDKVLLCCSQHSLTSWWVDNEVATAFNKEQRLMKDRRKKVLSLIPLNLDGFMFSDEWKSGKGQQIKERLAVDFTGWETDNDKFEEQFERVVKALQTEGARENAPASRL